MNRQTKSILTIVGLIVLGVILWLLFAGKSDTPNTNITKQDQPKAIMPDTKLAFVPTLLEIKRTYDQRGKVMLRNDGDLPINVRVDCDPPDDLNSGFIGRGSRDWFEPTSLSMGVGETWAFDFVVHANATQRDTASIPVVARVKDSAGDWQIAAQGKVDVKIASAPLKLKVQWEEGESPADQARLVKYLTITNMGVEIPNFTVNFTEQITDNGYPDMQAGPLFGKVLMDTVVERMHLQAGQSIKLRVWPRLSPSFIQLVGKIYLHGHKQRQVVDYQASVPDGQDVFVTVSRSTGVSGNSGDRCTNQGSASYAMPPTSGTPATPPSSDGGYGGGGGGGLSGSIGSGGSGTLAGSTGDDNPSDEEDEDEFAWGTPFGDVSGSSSSNADQSKDTTRDNTQTDASEDSELADQNLLDNSEALVEDLDEDAMIPASALGSDLIPMDELATTLGRSLDPNWGKKDILKPAVISDDLWDQLDALRDPQSATKETVVQAGKDGGVLVAKHNKRENTTALEFRNFGFGIQKGRKLKAGVPLVRNSYPVSQPTLGRSPSGKTVAAYSRPEGDKQIVTVQDVQTGKTVDIGVDGDQQATSPKIIRDPQSGKSFIQYVQDGQVKQSELGDDLTISKPQTVFAPQDKVQRILSSEHLSDGKQVTLAKTVNNKLLMKLPTQDKPVELDAKDGAVLANADDSVYVALRTKDNAIVVKTSENDSHQIAPPNVGNGPPTLVRTAAGHPRVIYHRKLANSTAADADQGGTFQADFIKGQWFPTKRAVQPEEPVTAAAVAVEFKPKYGKAHYKLMNTQIQLNGKTIGKLNERIPDGRYLYQVPADKLKYVSASGIYDQLNNVSMKIQGIGKGNFHVSDKVQIFTAHNLVQEYLVADSQKKAQQLAQSSSSVIRHHKPDIMVTNNRWELPRNVEPGDTVQATIGLFNVGDLPASPGRLIAKAKGKVLGQADYGVLESFAKMEVPLSIVLPDDEYVGNEPLQITVSTVVDQDANPEDNSITFMAYADYTEGLTGPSKPYQFDPDQLPVSALATVDISKEPYTFKLSEMSQWYRFKIPESGKGRLQVELHDADPSLILGVDLYTPQGKPLDIKDQKWQVPGEWVFLRIGLIPDRLIPDKASFAIAWNQTTQTQPVGQ